MIDDDKLDLISGGAGQNETAAKNSSSETGGGSGNGALSQRESFCPKCNTNRMFDLFSGGRAVCTVCEFQKFM